MASKEMASPVKTQSPVFFAQNDLGQTKSGAAKLLHLSDAKEGDSLKIVKIRGRGAIRQRLLDMGIGKGAVVKVVRFAPLMDPMQISVRGYDLALRLAECALIDVAPATEDGSNA